MLDAPADGARECVAAILKHARERPDCLELLWVSFIAVGDSIQVVTLG
jgi:hypothetical protein